MTKTHRTATVAALLLALFMAAMELTIISTAMPTVVAELGGTRHYAWVFSAYMLTSTVALPICGKVADLYGRKPTMLAAIAVFLVGSMACGQARTMGQLIAFRAVQGLGASGVQPMALTIIGDIFKLEERAKMQALFSGVWAIAGLVGPLLGGMIVAALSWRWVFYVNVPIGIAAAIVLRLALVEDVEPHPHRLDVAGALLLSLAVLSLLLGLEGIARPALLPIAGALLAALFFVERRASEPIVPIDLFAERTFATSSGILALAGAAMIGLISFVPLYAQGVLGTTPTEAGAAIVPMAIAWPITSAVSGRFITRTGFRPLVRFGVLFISLAALVLLFVMVKGASETELRIASGVFGVGMGLTNTSIVIAVQTSVGFSKRGVATASMLFFRNIGGTLGVGVMGVVLSRSLLTNPLVREGDGAQLVVRILGRERRTVDPQVLKAISADLAAGLVAVAWILVGIAVLALGISWLFPRSSSPQRAGKAVRE